MAKNPGNFSKRTLKCMGLSLIAHLVLLFPLLVNLSKTKKPGEAALELVSLVDFEVSEKAPSPRVHSKQATPEQQVAPDSIASPTDIVSNEKPVDIPKAASGAAAPVIAGEARSYLGELQQWLERQKVYPKAASRLGITGQAEVTFKIAKSGEFLDIQLAKSSASELLDQSALSLVKRASRFRPIPDEISERQLTVTVPVNYTIN